LLSLAFLKDFFTINGSFNGEKFFGFRIIKERFYFLEIKNYHIRFLQQALIIK